MFEDMTYENIMLDMMNDLPDGLNTQEGSLLYNACAKQALKLEECYVGLEYLYENLLPDTMDEEHLFAYAKERGIRIKTETKAILQGDFVQEIPIGTRFTRNDMNYIVLKKMNDFSYQLQCDKSGVIGNTGFGTLTPIDFVENWQGGELVKVLIPAQKSDSLEEIRRKIFDSFNVKEFGGNRSQYQRFFHDFDGVGAVKIQRKKKDTGFIFATVLDSDYNTPTSTLLEQLQTAIDPEVNQGEGEGFAPISHCVKVLPAKEKEIVTNMTIVFKNGFTKENMTSKIEQIVDTCFLEARKAWEQSDNTTIRGFQIMVALAKLDGIEDVKKISFGEDSDSAPLAWDEVPKRGAVNIVSST